tara:strand:- start:1409 stop:2971 length:1563 start_codon:yes stop_codon:yes gene_type:complete
MSKTGLMLASGLTKAVESFFKARELRDLKSQRQALDQVKQMRGLQDLFNSRLQGEALREDLDFSRQSNPIRIQSLEADQEGKDIRNQQLQTELDQLKEMFPQLYAKAVAEKSQEEQKKIQEESKTNVQKLVEESTEIDLDIQRATKTDAIRKASSESGLAYWKQVEGFQSSRLAKLKADFEAETNPLKKQKLEQEIQNLEDDGAQTKAATDLIDARIADLKDKADAIDSGATPIQRNIELPSYFEGFEEIGGRSVPETALQGIAIGLTGTQEKNEAWMDRTRTIIFGYMEEGDTEGVNLVFRTAAKSTMSATDARKLKEREVVLNGVLDINQLMFDYYEQAGEAGTGWVPKFEIELPQMTGQVGASLFTEKDDAKAERKFEKWKNNIGKNSRLDESQKTELQQIVNRIQIRYIAFRKQMTGAHFSAREAADYAKLFPDPKQSSEVNMQRLADMIGTQEDDILSIYESSIPVPRDRLKVLLGIGSPRLSSRQALAEEAFGVKTPNAGSTVERLKNVVRGNQ